MTTRFTPAQDALSAAMGAAQTRKARRAVDWEFWLDRLAQRRTHGALVSLSDAECRRGMELLANRKETGDGL